MKKILSAVLSIGMIFSMFATFGMQSMASPDQPVIDTQQITVATNESTYLHTDGGRLQDGHRILENGGEVVYKVNLNDAVTCVRVQEVQHSGLSSFHIKLSADGSNWLDYAEFVPANALGAYDAAVNRVFYTDLNEEAAYSVLQNNSDKEVYIKVIAPTANYMFLDGLTVIGSEVPLNVTDQGLDVVGNTYGYAEDLFLVNAGSQNIQDSGRCLENAFWVTYRFDLDDNAESVKLKKVSTHNGQNLVVEISKDGNTWMPLAEHKGDMFSGDLAWTSFTARTEASCTEVLKENSSKTVYLRFRVESGWVFIKSLELSVTVKTPEIPVDPTKPVIDGKFDEAFYKDYIPTTAWVRESYVATNNSNNVEAGLYVYQAEDALYFYGYSKDPKRLSAKSAISFGYLPDPSGIVTEDKVSDPSHVTYPIFTLTQGSANMEVMTVKGDGSYSICDKHDPTFDPTFYDWENNPNKFTTFVDEATDTYGFECVVPLKEGVPQVYFKLCAYTDDYHMSNGGQSVWGSDWLNWNMLDLESGVIFGGALGILDKSVTLVDEATGIEVKGNGLKNVGMTVTNVTSGPEFDALNAEIKANNGKLLQAFSIDMKKNGADITPDADGYSLSIPADDLDQDGEYEVYCIENGTATYLGTLLDTTGETPFVVSHTNGFGYFALSQVVDEENNNNNDNNNSSNGNTDDNNSNSEIDSNKGENNTPDTGHSVSVTLLSLLFISALVVVICRKRISIGK